MLQQTRHNFVGEIRTFSVKIRINPYPSMHRFIAKTFTRFISRCSLQTNRDIVLYKSTASSKKPKHRSFTSRGATVGLGLRLWLTRSIVLHGRWNLPFFGNLAEKASCVDDKTVLFRYTLFINCFPVICLKSVSPRDTAVSSQKRQKSVLDTDNPYQVACLLQ